MARSAKQPEPRRRQSSLQTGVTGLFSLVGRNPTLVAGSTAFLVALSFVSANALWYQPHAHSGAFFSTRGFAGPTTPEPQLPETTFQIERLAPAPIDVATSDPAIAQVQSILQTLKLYQGKVDGIAGPNTRQAIETYQSKMGLPVTGIVDSALMDQLGADPTTAGIVPIPPVREVSTSRGVQPVSAPGTLASDQRIMKIQAGLKAFGNDGIEIDGVLGSRTKSAILEFQALFGLPETGEPDEGVYAKMKEIGLTN